MRTPLEINRNRPLSGSNHRLHLIAPRRTLRCHFIPRQVSWTNPLEHLRHPSRHLPVTASIWLPPPTAPAPLLHFSLSFVSTVAHIRSLVIVLNTILVGLVDTFILEQRCLLRRKLNVGKYWFGVKILSFTLYTLCDQISLYNMCWSMNNKLTKLGRRSLTSVDCWDCQNICKSCKFGVQVAK